MYIQKPDICYVLIPVSGFCPESPARAEYINTTRETRRERDIVPERHREKKTKVQKDRERRRHIARKAGREGDIEPEGQEEKETKVPV